ncbi:MAG: murein biosynthesis integral membrane protein MurJ [Spirochaetia bacterium]|nr:murein biosynthesis integral membrane protein MurJ [Spirochaetia bacterium]
MKTVLLNSKPPFWIDIMEKHEEVTLNRVKKNSLILMVFTFISRVLGILRARVVANYFGASGVGDVINFTFNIPNNFRKLFAEGAFNSAFIPVFTRLVVSRERQKQLLRTLFGFQIVIMAPIIIGTYFFRVEIIMLFSDFTEVELILLASRLLSIFMVYLALISLYALLIGVLQSHNLFFIASVSPLLFSLTVIGSIILFYQQLGPYSMALGVILGGIFQIAFTFMRVKSLHYDSHISFKFSNSDFIDVMRRWMPVTFSALITIASQQVAFYFASTLKTGSVSYFSNAIIIWQAPYGIFFGAIATSIFPSLVQASSNVNKKFMKELTTHGLISLFALLIPSLLLLTLYGKQTSVVLFESGKYSLLDALNTSEVLFYFAISMPIAAWYTFLQRVSYAIDDYKPSLIVASIVAVVDIFSTILLLRIRGEASSIAIASIISFSLGLLMFLFYLDKKDVLSVRDTSFITKIVKITLANIPLFIYLYIMNFLCTPVYFTQIGTLLSFTILSGIYLGAIIITFIVYNIAHIELITLFKKKRG